MQRNARLKTAAVLMAASAVLFISVAIRGFYYDPQDEIAPPANVAFAASSLHASAYPAQIIVPAASVNAPIEDRGIVEGDRMAAPTNFTSVGWYEYGAVPGEAGTAILYGHLDNGLGLNGVFKNLDEVALGDPIQIQTKGGQTLAFKVTGIATYPYEALPSDALGEDDPNATSSQITLITCAGNLIYNPIEGFTYDHRLVITATYAGETPAL